MCLITLQFCYFWVIYQSSSSVCLVEFGPALFGPNRFWTCCFCLLWINMYVLRFWWLCVFNLLKASNGSSICCITAKNTFAKQTYVGQRLDLLIPNHVTMTLSKRQKPQNSPLNMPHFLFEVHMTEVSITDKDKTACSAVWQTTSSGKSGNENYKGYWTVKGKI